MHHAVALSPLVTYAVVCVVAFVVSALTLFSGFGLGTLLMPAFAVFFPAPVALAATAVVHLANNLFKLALVGRRADGGVVARFALPAVPAAMAGAARPRDPGGRRGDADRRRRRARERPRLSIPRCAAAGRGI